MNPRKLHKAVGLILVLPLVAWALTALIFYVKPGYADAYSILMPKTYPLDVALTIPPRSGWHEVRFLKTILGEHLLVRTDSGWQQLDPQSLGPLGSPGEHGLRELLSDAFAANPKRYGHIVRVSNDTVWTDTGVEVILDWNTLTLQQRGKDTDRIDMLYRIHYLQWTGNRNVDRILGLAGILLLLTLAVLGVRIAFGK